ncbi:MAG: hypothetical protein WA001_04045 [Patescibacteria group bacterium]
MTERRRFQIILQSVTPMMQDDRDTILSKSVENTSYTNPRAELQRLKEEAAPNEYVLRRVRAEYKRHSGSRGESGFPTLMLSSALREAARRLQRRGEAFGLDPHESYTTVFWLDGEMFLPFDPDSLAKDWDHSVDPQKNIREGWVPDVRDAKSGRQCRPVFPQWRCTVFIKVDYRALDDKTEPFIKEVFEVAGSLEGLGAFRPSNGGTYGTFKLVSLEPL